MTKELKVFKCEYCSKELSSKFNLNTHLNTCKEKRLKIVLNKEIEELKEKYNKEISQISEKSRLEIEELKLLNKKDKEEYESKLSSQKQEYEFKLSSQKQEYEFKLLSQKETLTKDYEDKIKTIVSEIQAKEIMHKEEIIDLNRYNDIASHELKIRKEEIKKLEDMLKEYMKNDAKRVDKKCDVTPVINKYQTINNIHTHVKPLDTSQERFDNLVTQFYDYPMYKKGVRGMVELLTTFFSYNGTEEENMGKLQAYCSDINRGYIKTLDANLSEKLHTLSSLFEMCKNSHPLKNKKVDYYNQMLDDLKAELKDDILAYEQSLIHSTDSFSEEKFKECFNKIKEKLYNFYKTITTHNLSENQ